jgi:hypothetical protein
MRTLTGFFTAALFAQSLSQAFAWSSPGHEVIAAEAYRQLSPGLKTKVSDLLTSHPSYATWTESFRNDNASLDLAAFVFMRASTWPDDIRREETPYNHPHWHYINYPLRPPRFAVQPEPSPDDDILFGLARSERTLANAKASPEERAIYLSWLIHLIGDLHQPLHCVSLFTDAYPKGDRGGNEFFIKPAQRGINLHSFWDGLLGTSRAAQTQWNYAIELEAEYPRKSLKELKKAKAPRDWSLESRKLAVERAYLRGELRSGSNPEFAAALPGGYAKTAKAVAERQAALAGYRLADEIQKYLK